MSKRHDRLKQSELIGCLNNMEQFGEWISVKDRLPPEGKQVLTLDMGKNFYPEYKIDYIVEIENEIIWACRRSKDFEKVTHWMHIPEPPK